LDPERHGGGGIVRPVERGRQVGVRSQQPGPLGLLDLLGGLGVPTKTAVMLCLRASKLDAVTAAFLSEHPRGVVLHRRFGTAEVAFDAYSRLIARRAARHPSLRRTGATIRWGLDDPGELETMGVGASVLEEWAFAQSDGLAKLDRFTRSLFRLSGWFAAARRAHRIVRVRLEGSASP